METLTKSQKLAQFFAALGHTRRLRIVNLLAISPKGLTFEDIETQTGITGSSLFHHLRPLRDAGLINRKIKGRFTFYSLDATPLRRHLGASVPQIMPHADR